MWLGARILLHPPRRVTVPGYGMARAPALGCPIMSPYLARIIRTLSIGQFVFLLSMAAMILAVIAVLLMSTFVERRAIRDLAQKEARQTSEMIFQSLYTAMRKGWTKEEIGEIIQRLNESQPGTDIRVFRGAPVIAQFGDIPGEAVVPGPRPAHNQGIP